MNAAEVAWFKLCEHRLKNLNNSITNSSGLHAYSGRISL